MLPHVSVNDEARQLAPLWRTPARRARTAGRRWPRAGRRRRRRRAAPPAALFASAAPAMAPMLMEGPAGRMDEGWCSGQASASAKQRAILQQTGPQAPSLMGLCVVCTATCRICCNTLSRQPAHQRAAPPAASSGTPAPPAARSRTAGTPCRRAPRPPTPVAARRGRGQ